MDVKALLRIAVVYNIPIAYKRSTADFLLSSPLMHRLYERRFDDRQTEGTDYTLLMLDWKCSNGMHYAGQKGGTSRHDTRRAAGR